MHSFGILTQTQSIYVYDFYGVNMVKPVEKPLAAYSSTFSMYYIASDWSDDCGELLVYSALPV